MSTQKKDLTKLTKQQLEKYRHSNMSHDPKAYLAAEEEFKRRRYLDERFNKLLKEIEE